MAPSARAWAVSKLKSLSFEGDADALGQYVDALIENNRDTEEGDPALLRAHVTADLKDFLEDAPALDFVNGLMAHLTGKPAPKLQPQQLKVEPAQQPQITAPMLVQPTEADKEKRPSFNDDKLRQPLSDGRRRSPRPRESGRREDGRREDGRREERRERREDRPRNIEDRARNNDDRARIPDVRDRLQKGPKLKQSVIERLGDREEHERDRKDMERSKAWEPKQHWEGWELRQRQMREQRQQQQQQHTRTVRRSPNANTNMQTLPTDLRERIAGRGAKRGRDDPDDNVARERNNAYDREAKFGRRGNEPARRRSDEFGRNRMDIDDKREDRKDQRRDDKHVANVWPPPPGNPAEMMSRMRMMPPPFPPMPGMMPPPPLMPGVHPRGGRGAFRGRDGGRNASAGGRHRHFILIARFIPEDKMAMMPIISYFQRFGPLRDVQRFPPDRAFIMFERRDAAQSALNSVDAVLGNRHVKLFWARDQDFGEAGLKLNEEGMLVNDDDAKKGTAGDGVALTIDPKKSAIQERERAIAEREEQARLAAEKKAAEIKAGEEDLKKKKEMILENRRKQEARKTELNERFASLVEKQKTLLQEITTISNEEEKAKKMTELRGAQAEAEKVREEMKPKALAPPSNRFTRDLSSFKVDNRPKNVVISGAKPEVTAEIAVAIFRETDRAEKITGGWLLMFSSRRAAESALRAIGPLKRGFGPDASAQIVESLPNAGVSITSPGVAKGMEASIPTASIME